MTIEDELLAQITAEPRNDEPRRIYADLLVERGDPRGEFVALQLAAADSPLDERGARRMRELEREHARAWLGPLAAIVDKPRFERGFLTRALLGSARTPPGAWQIALDPRSRTELASLSEVELADSIPFEAMDTLLAAMPSLTRLVIGTRQLLGFERRVSVLGVRVDGAPAARVAIESVPAGEHAPDEVRLVTAGLEELERVVATALSLGRLLAPTTHRIGFEAGGATIVARRDDAGHFTILDVTATKATIRRLSVFTLPFVLDAVRDHALTRLAVDGPLEPRDMRAIERACTRFADLELVFL
jgi:uncharacterized protein (TIGR02996 family)